MAFVRRRVFNCLTGASLVLCLAAAVVWVWSYHQPIGVVWQTAANFRGTSKLSTWVFAIAYRKALKARMRWPDPVEDDQADLRASNDPAPDAELERSRVHSALVGAMRELPAEQRAVVDLTYFHGLGYREIAEILNCPVDTVKTRMFHARRRLKQALSGTLADWL